MQVAYRSSSGVTVLQKGKTMNEIMGISRHRLATEGDGIRSLVSFYGCPLNCRYCINGHCKDNKTRRMYIEPEILVGKLSIDNMYFKMTGGGLTFGGGEPLTCAEYIKKVCEIADPGWKMNIETSLYAEQENVRSLIPYIDKWIIDIKDFDPVAYKKYTGKSNKLVLSNLEMLSREIGKNRLHIRVPLIPGFNDEKGQEENIKIAESYAVSVERFEYIKF